MESQWLAQLAAMRQAVVEIKLDQQDGQVKRYGHNIVVDDEDLSDENLDEIWDMSSDTEDDYSSDNSKNLECTMNQNNQEKFKNALGWLKSQCDLLTNRRHRLDAGRLQDQLYTLLISDMKGTCSASLDASKVLIYFARRR